MVRQDARRFAINGIGQNTRDTCPALPEADRAARLRVTSGIGQNIRDMNPPPRIAEVRALGRDNRRKPNSSVTGP